MIKELIKLIRTSGSEILKIYNQNNFDIKIKNDDSPITKADILSHKILKEGLFKIDPVPVLSEEEFIDFNIRKDWKKFWIIDPLDGTKDFIAKNDEFTINIALIENRRPVIGLIYAPALNELYWAIKGKGAFKNGKKIYNSSLRKNIIGTQSRFHSNKKTEMFFNINKINKVEKFGSALKFCKLSEGSVDVYPRYNGSMEWDIAAGDIILQESGCKMINIKTSKEFCYNRLNLINDFFIAQRDNLDLVKDFKKDL